MKFNPITPLLFYVKTTTYVSGEGVKTEWTKVIDGSLFCEWRGGFGDRAIAAQAQGVKEMATVRTFYHPTVYEKLRTVHVVILKNADTTAIVSGAPNPENVNTYELWGGVDNVGESNQYIEFRVRRYEPK